MELRGLCLFLVLMVRSISAESLYYKVPKDHDPTKEIRGNSFGLENFLLQAYKEADTVNVNENAPVKRLRGKETYKKPESISNRGQTYGLEMLTPNLYNFGQSPTGLSSYITDFKPVTEPEQEYPKRRLPEVQSQKYNDHDERRERIKTRKQVVRRPVSTTKAPSTTTQRVVELDNSPSRYEGQEQNQEQETLINETVEAASYAVAKTQEIPASDKDADDVTKQRPRKRVTMRRRRKRPQSSHNSDNNVQANEASSVTEGGEGYEIQKEVNYVPAQTTTSSTTTLTTTTTIKPRTDKERPSRKRPGGFRKAPVDDVEPTRESGPQTEYTTIQYGNDSEANEANSPTVHTPEVSGYAEEPSEKPITTTYKPTATTTTTTTTTTTSTTTTAASITSSEETSAADLKTFLKQQNGPLSLSELLQTQNLSLADFLKNRKEAALILSGRRGAQSTSVKPDSREGRPNFNTRSRPFSRNRQETDDDETRSTERNKSVEVTTVATDRYTYNGFVPKNPRNRNSQGKVHPTYKPYYGSQEKSSERRTFTKDQDRHSTENLAKRLNTTEALNQTTGGAKGIPKRFNDMRLKLRIHRRKYNPHSTTKGIGKSETTETSTIPVTTTTVTSTQTPRQHIESSTTEEITTTKRIGLRIPFKSSNNPELSLILPSKNKTEEKPEKRERYSNYASRVQGLKRPSPEKEDLKETNTLEQSTIANSNDSANSNPNLPLDAIDFDDEKDIIHETEVKETVNLSKEEKDKSSDSKRADVVGKIPLPNEVPKYEPKDEILELLKPGGTSDRLQRILESRNMTVKELIENREKSSLQTNFTQLFQENSIQKKRNEIRTTADPTFKVFQSLPDFEPIHRNLFQKNVKEVKSNSYPDSQIDESRPKPVQTRVNSSATEQRGSKQFNGMFEVKKKLQLNSDSESRDTSLETNDGAIDRWNKREKVLFYNTAFPKPREKLPPVRTIPERFPMNNKAENEVAETDIILLETIRRSQEANQKLKSNINEILQEQSEVREINNDIDKSFIPPAVKSAIIASGIVMGLALFVFVAIFAACGWKQRQIRLRARSSILNDALAKSDSGKKIQRTSALSPVNFKQGSIYKKTLEMDDESSTSASLSSNASSYLWNTLKNTFTGRSTTLKNRLDKEDKLREERLEGLKSALRSQENRRSDLLVEEDVTEECFSNAIRRQDGRYSIRKNDCAKSPSFTSSNHFSSCTHGH